MMYLMHLNDFYEFGSIEPNSKKHRNIEKIRFGSIELIRTNSIEFDSVRFGSIFQESSRVSLYSDSLEPHRTVPYRTVPYRTVPKPYRTKLKLFFKNSLGTFDVPYFRTIIKNLELFLKT